MRIRCCVPFILLLGYDHGVLADLLYSVTDLGTLSGSSTQGIGINNAGQVTGDSQTVTGQNHAFLYSGGQMLDLGTLGGDLSAGEGINNAGQVTGRGAYGVPQPYNQHWILQPRGRIFAASKSRRKKQLGVSQLAKVSAVVRAQSR